MKKIVAFLVLVCMLFCSTAYAAGTDALQEVPCGGVTFLLPAEMQTEVSEHAAELNGASLCVGAAEDGREILIIVYPWDDLGMDIKEWSLIPNGGLQRNNAAALMIASGTETEMINTMINVLQEVDIGMPSGEPVLCYVEEDGAICYHYDCNVGVEIIGFAQTGNALEMCLDIMRMIRWDDVSEENENADAQVDYVVVTADSGRIRAEASLSGELIKTAYKGETYKLIERSGDWYIIEVNGRTGYLHTGVSAIK